MELSSRFKRGLEHNYIVFENLEINEEDYQYMMIKHNKISGLCNFECKNNNGQIRLCYEVSSKQSLKQIYENNLMNYEALKNIIMSVYYAIKNIHEYMLDENYLVIKPEYIFMNVESYEVSFIFLPFYEGDLNENFLNLAEFFLDKIDHQNNSAVMLAYNMFKLLRNDSFIMDNLIKLVSDNNMTQAAVEKDHRIELNDDDIYIEESENKENEIYDTKYNKDENWFGRLGIFNTSGNNREGKKGLSLFGKRKKDKKIDKDKESILESIMKDEYQEYQGITEPDIEYGKTMLLVSDNTNTNINNVTQHTLTNVMTKKVYSFDKYPVTIGKVKDLVNVVMDDPAISRMHACISEIDGRYYIKDIGSSNGTYLNGLLVEEDIELETDDEVTLGNVRLTWK